MRPPTEGQPKRESQASDVAQHVRCNSLRQVLHLKMRISVSRDGFAPNKYISLPHRHSGNSVDPGTNRFSNLPPLSIPPPPTEHPAQPIVLAHIEANQPLGALSPACGQFRREHICWHSQLFDASFGIAWRNVSSSIVASSCVEKIVGFVEDVPNDRRSSDAR
jgi:hypothetical protein